MASHLTTFKFILVSLLTILNLTPSRGLCWHINSHLSSLGDTRCCAGEEFNYKFLEEHVQTCSVPPKDDSLCLSNCFWNFVQCLASKSLNGKPFSLTDFARSMTSTLSDKMRTDILTELQLKSPIELMIHENHSEREKIKIFREIWSKYFDAEFEVCHTKQVKQDTVLRTKDDEKFPDRRQNWEPTYTCNNVTFPRLTPFDPPENKVRECRRPYDNKYTFENSTSYDRFCVYTICNGVASDWIDKQDLNVGANYQAFVHKVMPNYLSKQAQQTILQQLPLALSTTFTTKKGDSLDEIIDKTINYTQNEVNPRAMADELREPCKNVYTLQQLAQAVETAKYSICENDEPVSMANPLHFSWILIVISGLLMLKF